MVFQCGGIATLYIQLSQLPPRKGISYYKQSSTMISLADDACLAKSNWLPISYFYEISVLMLMTANAQSLF